MDYDRLFYSIEVMDDGTKMIHLSAKLYKNDADSTQTPYRLAEWSFLYFTADEARQMIKEDKLYDFIEEKIKYLDDLSEEEAIDVCKYYHNGTGGTELPMSEIADDTPCGNYYYNF